MKKIVALMLALLMLTLCFAGCEMETNARTADTNRTLSAANTLQENQPTPTDIDYSLERYNLTRRAYWVNGQREKANALACPVVKPMGYVVLLAGNTIMGAYEVDGKVSSLNSYLTPDSQYYERDMAEVSGINHNEWLSDVDGSYGTNDNGIFFFTPQGNYIEWTGEYLYSDMPFHVDNPILTIKGE